MCHNSFSFDGNIFIIIKFYMKIGSIIENINLEKRVAITPEIAKKLSDNNFQVISKKLCKTFRF